MSCRSRAPQLINEPPERAELGVDSLESLQRALQRRSSDSMSSNADLVENLHVCLSLLEKMLDNQSCRDLHHSEALHDLRMKSGMEGAACGNGDPGAQKVERHEHTSNGRVLSATRGSSRLSNSTTSTRSRSPEACKRTRGDMSPPVAVHTRSPSPVCCCANAHRSRSRQCAERAPYSRSRSPSPCHRQRGGVSSAVTAPTGPAGRQSRQPTAPYGCVQFQVASSRSHSHSRSNSQCMRASVPSAPKAPTGNRLSPYYVDLSSKPLAKQQEVVSHAAPPATQPALMCAPPTQHSMVWGYGPFWPHQTADPAYAQFPVAPTYLMGFGGGMNSDPAGVKPLFNQQAVPLYDGSSSWLDYERLLEQTAERYGWTKNEKLLAITVNLRGRALQLYGQMSAEVVLPTFEQVRDLMRSKFLPPTISKYKRFRYRIQEPQESLKDFARELKALSCSVFEDAPQAVVTDILMHQFIDGLRDRNLQRLVVSKQPRNFTEAVLIAQELQDSYARERHVKWKLQRTYSNQMQMTEQGAVL